MNNPSDFGNSKRTPNPNKKEYSFQQIETTIRFVTRNRVEDCCRHRPPSHRAHSHPQTTPPAKQHAPQLVRDTLRRPFFVRFLLLAGFPFRTFQVEGAFRIACLAAACRAAAFPAAAFPAAEALEVAFRAAACLAAAFRAA